MSKKNNNNIKYDLSRVYKELGKARRVNDVVKQILVDHAKQLNREIVGNAKSKRPRDK